MTPDQLLTFKAAMLADANIAAFVAAKDAQSITAYYNGAGTGSLWRPSISASELNNAVVWSEFAGLTVALQNTYLAMIAVGYIDATNVNIRNGFSTVFTGKTSLTNLATLAQRTATKFEALYAAGNVCPLFGYMVTPYDVGLALA